MLKVVVPGRISVILLSVFSLAAAIIIIAGMLVYRGLERKTMLSAYSELSALSQAKIREVTNWRKERLNDATFIMGSMQFKNLASRFLSDTADIKSRNSLTDFIRPLKNNHEYTDVILIDTAGKEYPLFSKVENKLLDRDRDFFLQAIKERKALLSDINRHDSDKIIHMSSFTPLFLSDKSNVFGVVEIKMDPSKILFPAIQMSSGSSESAETFLVRREGNYVLFLNNLKYRSNSALSYKQPLTNVTLPAAKAVLGKEGIFEGRDYRGVPVLADLRRIADSPWYIVSKIDKDELYSPLKLESVAVTGFVVVLVLLCGIIAYALWKQQQLKFLEHAMKSRLDKEMLLERIEHLIKNANDIILLFDEQGKIAQVNDKAVMVYGYTFEEFSSLNLVDIRAENTRGEIERDKQKVLEMGGHIFETFHLKKDGSEFPVEISSRVIEIEGKKYFQSIIRDITERKQYEEKLKSTIDELNRSNRDLEQFAYVGSHDLQEPLRMVNSYAQLFERKYRGKLDDTAEEYLNFLTEGARRMQHLIKALLEYSRINSAADDQKVIDINEAVKTALKNLRLQIQESQAAIEYDNLPRVRANFSQIVQLMQNLISNSIKYRNNAPPKIKISAEADKDSWIFSVQDNGIGIDKEYYEKIFQLFQRLHAREDYPGTGIGLALCKKIVEHHGGKIWVKSEEGKGSAFYFTIPKLV